jgi:hypothetical protein
MKWRFGNRRGLVINSETKSRSLSQMIVLIPTGHQICCSFCFSSRFPCILPFLHLLAFTPVFHPRSHILPSPHPFSTPLWSRPLVFTFSSFSLLFFLGGGAFLQHLLLVCFAHDVLFSPRLLLTLIRTITCYGFPLPCFLPGMFVACSVGVVWWGWGVRGWRISEAVSILWHDPGHLLSLAVWV